MEDELKKLKSRSFYSVSSLLAMSSYSAFLGFAAFFILTIRSGAYLLGIYNTVLAMMSFFNYLTNLGLAAAIIQKKEVEKKDLNTAFFIQLTLTSVAVVVGFFLTAYLFKFYKDLPTTAIYLYWSLLISFFLLSLKTIPSVLLEKRIKIYKVVVVQAVENTVFYLCIIVFSIMGYDLFSLVIAVLARSIIGTVLIYIMNPWVPSFSFSFKSAKELLKYGIPFQGNSFLAMIKDDLLIIYLGGAIGLKNLGYVMFAKKYAEFSIRLIMDNINRVAFPLFSNLQSNKEILKKSLEKVLFYESLLIFPIIIGAIFVFDNFLKLIPGYYSKWSIALFSFYFFSGSAFFVSLTTPFINLFNAIGRVKLSLYFMVLWTALTWIFVPAAIKIYGFNGISIAFFIMSLTFIIVFLTARKFVEFTIQNSLKSSVLATILMTIYLIFLKLILFNFIANVYLQTLLALVGATIVYLTAIWKIKGKDLYLEFNTLMKKKEN